MNFTGYVNGIDVIATLGRGVRCFAFINKSPSGTNYIQVETEEHRLQTALELASSTKNVEVEVTYEDVGGAKVLRRVKLLDR